MPTLSTDIIDEAAAQQAIIAAENLAVQQDIAAATTIMAGTGAAALILSAVGVFLIWKTLRESQGVIIQRIPNQ